MFHLNPGHDLRKDQPDVNLCGEMFRSKYRSANSNTDINACASEHINTNAGYHFDIGCLRKSSGDANEESGEDEKRGKVDSDNGLEEEVLEEVGSIDDGEHEDGGKVDGEDRVEETSLEHHRHLQARVCVARVLVRQSPVISMSATSSV